MKDQRNAGGSWRSPSERLAKRIAREAYDIESGRDPDYAYHAESLMMAWWDWYEQCGEEYSDPESACDKWVLHNRAKGKERE